MIVLDRRVQAEGPASVTSPRGARARGEAEGVVHMRRPPRLKVTSRDSTSKCSVLPVRVLYSFHFCTTTRSPLPVFAQTRISLQFLCLWNLCQHPVDSNAPRSSPTISVVTTDKTNRYASSTRHSEYY